MSLPPLPPVEMRVGRKERQDDDLYLKSAVELAEMLGRHCGVSAEARLLDLGCGQARLLYGLLSVYGALRRYVGVDVSESSISWLKSAVEPVVPFAEFYLSDYPNERYNPAGEGDLVLPEGPFDCAVLWSLFTHMRLADVKRHLGALANIVPSGGYVLLSAFVGERDRDEEENPDGAGWSWRGPLHGVLFGRHAFENAIVEAGWKVVQRLPWGSAWSFVYILERE